ncbi:MAG: S9 family peptidase, partial [Bacteroidota bacterium]
MKLALRYFSLFLLLACSLELSAQKRSLEIDDYFSIKSLQSPRISPDGKWVAWLQRESLFKEEKSETSLWMRSLEGGEALRMTAKGSSVSQPRWSPDGKYLSFVANRNESKSQVWGLNRQGGEAQQLTKVKQGINGYEWAPDGKSLLLSIREEAPKDPKAKKGKKDSPKPWVIDRLQFKRDYAGYLDTLHTHLYVQGLGDTALTQLTFGDFDASQARWSPDGSQVAFVSNRTDNPDGNSNTDIWLLNLDDPKALTQLTTNPGSDYGPSWSPDGKSIAYITVTQPEIIWYASNHLALLSVEGKKSKVLTQKLDRNISNINFSADGLSLFFELEDSGESQLARMSLKGGKIERLIKGNDILRDYALGPNGNICALISKADLPGDIFLYRPNGMQQLTEVNKTLLDSLSLVSVEARTFKSKDGAEIEGFFYKPLGFEEGKKYPTLLRIHGGPVAQYTSAFNFEAQLFAAKGYLVIMTNPRGSSGYGQDFSLAIFQDWGKKDFEDVMAGVDLAIEMGWADPDRLGVGGWSYGGILTNYVITQTERFHAAISG